jgi:CRP/FNR family transcriptional regulator, cyclic AMP receptor protein
VPQACDLRSKTTPPVAPGTGSRTQGAQPCCRLLPVRPGHDVLAGLARSYLFEGMTRDQIEPLAAVTRPRDLVRGEHVCHVGDPANEIFVVLSGELKGYAVAADGEEVIHSLHGPGMTFGEPGYFAAERIRIVAVIAVEPSTLLRLDRRDLVPFMEQHTGVKDRVLERLASNSRWQTMVIASLATRPLTDRLVLRLLELVDSSPESGTGRAITPKISQTTLAAMIGVSRENVNRALAALMADGDIKQESGRYLLVDEQRLRRRVAREWPLVARRDRRIDSPVL